MLNQTRDSSTDKKIFNGLLNTLNELIILINTDGKIIYINEPACRWLKSTPEQLEGNNLLNYFSNKENNYYTALFETKKSQHFEQIINGTILLYNFYPIINELNQISQITVYIKDITKIRKLEDIIINLLDQKNNEIDYNPYTDFEQYLTGMSYLLQVLLKKINSYSIPEETLVSQIVNYNHEALEKIKKNL